MQRVLQTISSEEIVTGPVYDFQTELSGGVQTIRYPVEILLRWSDVELAAIDLIWVIVADPEPSYFQKIDNERDRRIALGFTFQGKNIQCRNDSDWINIDMAFGRAVVAVTLGNAQPGDLEWDEVGKTFSWITGDNSTLPLDAQGMIEMGTAVGRWRSNVHRNARVMKDARPSLSDAQITDDSNWPSNTASI